MTIKYEVSATTQEVETLVQDIVDNEARAFAATVRRRLVELGVDNVRMSVNEASS